MEQLTIDFMARPRFDGVTYNAERDEERLTGLLLRTWEVVRDNAWHTIPEIAAKVGGSEASISARLRDLRKVKFGSHRVDREYVRAGLFRYRVG